MFAGLLGKFLFIVLFSLQFNVYANSDASSEKNKCAHFFQTKSDYTKYDAGLFDAFPTDKKTLSKVRTEEQNSQKVSNFLMASFRRQSDILKQQLRSKNETYDLICVGAGIQCAAVSLMAKEAQLKTLVLEKSDLVARNFAEKDFSINSTESAWLSMHPVVGSRLQLSELTSQKYASSSQLATKIQADQYTSRVPVLLNTEVQSLFFDQTKNLMTIQTADGFKISSRKVVLGTGLGKATTKVPNPEYKKAFNDFSSELQKNPTQILPIMSTDALLVALKSFKQQKMGIRLPRDIVIIGNGDGSKIVLEALSSLKLDPRTRIQWIGNGFKNTHDYLQSVEGWDRYVQKVIPHYESGRLTGVDGRVQEIQFPSIKIKLKAGDLLSVQGDLIIDATGYDNVNAGLLQMDSSSSEIKGFISTQSDMTVLGKQYSLNGKALPVYAVGASGGLLATEAELANLTNKNPVSIYNTARRTAALIRQIYGLPVLNEVSDGSVSARLPVLSAEEILQRLK